MDGKGYTVSKWKEHDKFTCTSCAFDTLDEQQMIEHVKGNVHPHAPEKQEGE